MQDWMIALIASLFGGGGLKVIEWWLSRGQQGQSEARLIREELRSDLLKSEQRVDKLEVENVSLRDKYYKHKNYVFRAKSYIEHLVISIETICAQHNIPLPPIVTVVKNSDLMKGDIENDE